MENKTAFSDFNDERLGTEQGLILGTQTHLHRKHTHAHILISLSPAEQQKSSNRKREI